MQTLNPFPVSHFVTIPCTILIRMPSLYQIIIRFVFRLLFIPNTGSFPVCRLLDSAFLMLPEVVIKMPLRRKRLQTPGDVAMVRPFASVDAQMRLQVALLVECALTLLVRTYELLLA